jgi:glycosidase
MAHDVGSVPRNAYRMAFADNHDMNSWNGTPQKNFGNGLEMVMAFCGVVNGMPLVYSGEEAGLDRSLKFFDKDPIDFSNLKYEKFYKTLFDLKHKNHALWNGKYGGEMIRIVNDKQDKVLSFYREKNADAVLPLFNFSDEELTVTLDTKYFQGNYTELFSQEKVTLKDKYTVTLKPWGYQILVKN